MNPSVMNEGWPILDFRKFPNEAISGQTLSQINRIMENDYVFSAQEFDDFFNKDISFDDIEAATNSLPTTVVNMLDETEESMKPKSTSIQEKLHSSRFLSFLAEKNIDCDLECITSSKLNDYLRYFYHELRTKTGNYYNPASLKCVRAALHRYFTQKFGSKFNIIDGDDFASANRMLKSMAGLWLAHGGQKKQYVSIEENDLKTIFSSFNRSTGEELQNEVLFSLLFYLGARGREELRRIKRTDVCFAVDSNGVKYAFIKSEKDNVSEPNNIRKNVKVSLKPVDYENTRSNRIYDAKAIECLESYLTKLSHDAPEGNELFHRPVYGKKAGSRFYSDKQVRGENYLGNFMKKISKSLNLSKLYTNHCVRCTTVTRAKENGLASSDICLITGHKDPRSVDRYDRPSDARKHKLSCALTIENSTANGTHMKVNESLTVSALPEKKMKITVDGNTNIINFEFQ